MKKSYFPLHIHFSQLFFEHLIQFFFQAIFIYPTIFLRYELWLCFKCPSLSFVSLLVSYFTNNNSFLQVSMDPWLELTDGLTWSTGEWLPLLSASLLSPLPPAQSSKNIFSMSMKTMETDLKEPRQIWSTQSHADDTSGPEDLPWEFGESHHLFNFPLHQQQRTVWCHPDNCWLLLHGLGDDHL